MNTTKHVGMAVALVLCTVIYAFGLNYGAIATFDDAGYIQNNPVVTGWWSAPFLDKLLTPGIGYPIPIPVAVYALAWNVFHDFYPLTIRLVALLAHLLTGLTWYIVLQRRTGQTTAAIAAAVWLMHPLQAESIMWLSNLKSPLQVLFVALAVLVSDRIINDDTPRTRGTLVISLLTMLALFSKPTGAIAPAAILLPILLANQPLNALRSVGPAAAISACFVAVWAMIGFGDHTAMVDKSHMVTDTLWYRVSSGLAAFRRLIEIVVTPWNLGPYYAEPPVIPVMSWLGGLILVIIALGAFVMAVKARTDRSMCFAFSLATIAVFWAPYSHITFIPRFASDTYAAGPMLGFALLFALALPQRGKLFAIAVTLALAALSFVQRDRWQNGETLWGEVLQVSPESIGATQHVAYALMAEGRMEDARKILDDHRSAFRVHRKYPIWVAHFYLGQGDLIAGLNFLAEALEYSKNTEGLSAHRTLFLQQLVNSSLPIPPHMFELVKTSIQLELQESKPTLTTAEVQELTRRMHPNPDTR